MKLSKYFMMAAASLALFACSNDEDIPGLNGEGTKSVALKLEGLSSGTSTKAVGDAQKAGQIALSNVTIYFTDGTNILKKETLSTSNTTEWGELTTTGHIFHQLPSTVSQIQIVGNKTITLAESTVAKLKESVLKAAGEQTFTNVTLFGEDTSLSAGSPTVSDSHDDNILTATVNLKPLVARFEIGNIACTDVPNGAIKKYSLDVIGLINFNSGITLNGTTASGSYTLDNILAPGSTATSGKYIFGETSDDQSNDYTDVKWAWDKITTATDITNGADWNPNTDQKFVYQFIPDKVGTTDVESALMPQIKLVLKNIEWADGSANPFNSVVTASFKVGETPLSDFEAGKIYTVDYRFTSGNVGPWNPGDMQCIKIDVKVASWEVVALTPVFE